MTNRESLAAGNKMKVYFCTELRKNSPLRGTSEKYCTLQLLVRSLFVAFASIVLSLEKQCGGIYLETNGRAKMDEPTNYHPSPPGLLSRLIKPAFLIRWENWHTLGLETSVLRQI